MVTMKVGLKDGQPVAYDPGDPLSSYGVAPAKKVDGRFVATGPKQYPAVSHPSGGVVTYESPTGEATALTAGGPTTGVLVKQELTKAQEQKIIEQTKQQYIKQGFKDVQVKREGSKLLITYQEPVKQELTKQQAIKERILSEQYDPRTGTKTKETLVGEFPKHTEFVKRETIPYGYPSTRYPQQTTTATAVKGKFIEKDYPKSPLSGLTEKTKVPGSRMIEELIEVPKGFSFGALTFIPGTIATGVGIVKTAGQVLTHGPGVIPAKVRRIGYDLTTALQTRPTFTLSTIAGSMAMGTALGKIKKHIQTTSKVKPKISVSKTRYITEADTGKSVAVKTGEILIDKKKYQFKILTRSQPGKFTKQVKPGVYKTVPADLGGIEQHQIFITTPKGKQMIMYGFGKTEEVSRSLGDIITAPGFKVQQQKGLVITDVETVSGKVTPKILDQRWTQFLKAQDPGVKQQVSDWFKGVKVEVGKGLAKYDLRRIIPSKPKPMKKLPMDVVAREYGGQVSIIGPGNILDVGKFKGVKVLKSFRPDVISTSKGGSPLLGIYKPASKASTAGKVIEMTAKSLVKPAVSKIGVVGIGVAPTTQPKRVVQSISAYFSRVGTILPKEQLGKRVVVQTPDLSQDQLKAFAFQSTKLKETQKERDDQRRKQLQKPISISAVSISPSTGIKQVLGGASQQGQRQLFKQYQQQAQLQALEQAQIQKVVPVSLITGRVFPPRTTQKVVTFEAGPWSMIKGKKRRVPNWFKYYLRKWPVAYYPKEIKKSLFGG